MRYFTYGNAGGIDKVIAREPYSPWHRFHDSLQSIFDMAEQADPDAVSLHIISYGYDIRLESDVYMLVGYTEGDTELDMYQRFICYIIEV